MRVSVDLPVPINRAWAELRDIGSHVAWMDDAVSITFTSKQHEGVGTTFVCVTRIGPIRLRDHMQVTEWVDGKRIGIAHEGLIRGSGTFELKKKGRNQTRLVWKERLRPPRWLGGPFGGVVAGMILHRVARRDLHNLRGLFE